MLSQRLEETCQANADQIAVFDPTDTPTTYRSFFFTLVSFAEQLQDHGIEPGDHVTVEIDDAISGTLMRLALLRLGATVVPPPRPNAAHYRIDCRIIALATTAFGAVPVIGFTDAWIRSPSRMVPVAGGGRMVKATSGTTGFPKLRLADEAAILARVELGLQERQIVSGPVLIGYNPAAGTGFGNILRCLMSDHAHAYIRTSVDQTLDMIEHLQIKTALLPAAKLPWLVDGARNRHRSPSLDVIQAGGGAVSPALAREAERLFGAEVFNAYGSNETGSISRHRPASEDGISGVVGHIYQHLQYRFQDEAGQITDDKIGGELWLRVPEAFREQSFPDQTPIHDPDGWISTGDLGHILPNGMLKLDGRVSDLINLGGNKRSPLLVEAVVRDLPGLRDVAAFRIETSDGIDEIGIAICADAGFDVNALPSILAKALGQAFPLHLVSCDHLPLTPAGKIDRRALTQAHSPIFSAGENGLRNNLSP